ncbi:MAG: extracellular solute-binding protein, partial [Psychromonas sp.]
ILITDGEPHYKSYYAGVDKVVVDDRLQVTFQFKQSGNRELPLIVAQIPIFPMHFWQGKNFAKSGLIIPLGSGPYRIEGFDAGKQVVYQRNDNYWAKALAVNKGRYNFDRLIFDYYRDDAVAFEAFKSGAFDYRLESSAKRWSTGYVGEQFDNGAIKLEQIEDKTPQGMQGFWFNLRRDKFKDPKVRKAISLLFDFEWANKTLFYGAYTRINSFYSGSELATNTDISDAEKVILTPHRQQLPDSVFSSLIENKTRGDGNVRQQMRQAVALLEAAGYTLKDSKMQNKQGQQLSFEFLLYSKDFERIIHPFRRNLQRIGINTDIRLVDISQFINRLNNFQFDLVSLRKGQSISPGNEQVSFWGCESVNQVGTSNWAGICSPVIDELTKQLINASTRQELVDITKALDRVLLSQNIVIPQWYLAASRIAYWDKFKHPKIAPKYQLGLDTWWAKDSALFTHIEQEQ